MGLTAALLWLPRRVNQLLDKYAAKRVEHDKILVQLGHDHERGLWLRVIPRFIGGLGALLVLNWLNDTVWGALASAALGLIIGTWCTSAVGRASAYRTGWLDGRLRFAQQGQSHANRGNTLTDWMNTELDHDTVHVLGLPPAPRPRD